MDFKYLSKKDLFEYEQMKIIQELDNFKARWTIIDEDNLKNIDNALHLIGVLVYKEK